MCQLCGLMVSQIPLLHKILCLYIFETFNFKGTYKVRNEIETKRNETKRNEINENETKRNEINEMKTK